MLKIRNITFIAALVLLCNGLTAQKAKRKTVPQKKKTEVEVTKSVEKVEAVSESTSEFKWYGFEEGYKKAIKENKILLVDAYTEWCGWCKVMDRETYTDATVIETLKKDFICVKFNPEIDKTYIFGDRSMDGRTLLLWLGHGESGGYPTTYFVLNPSKNDNRFNQPGYFPPTEFLKLLDNAKVNRSK